MGKTYDVYCNSDFPQSGVRWVCAKQMQLWKVLCFVQATKRWKEVTHFIPWWCASQQAREKKRTGQEKWQIFRRRKFKHHMLIFICTNVCSGQQDFSDVSLPCPHIRITDIISPYWAPAEPNQLLLSSSPGATTKDRNRETPSGFLDAHLLQLPSVLCNSVFYWFTVELIFLLWF